MKKILLLMITALAALPLYAQKPYIYAEDDFDNDAEFCNYRYWDYDGIHDAVRKFNDGETNWMGWIFDPEGHVIWGGYDERTRGLSYFQTKPFDIAEDGQLGLRFWLWYYSDYASRTRNLGFRIKEGEEGEWDTLYTLREEGKILMPSPLTEQVGNIYYIDTVFGTKYNGKKNVVLQIFCYNDSSANDGFVLAVDDILFQSFSDKPWLSTRITNTRFWYGERINLNAVCSNNSSVQIEKVRYAYTVNGTDVETTDEIVFNPVMKPYNSYYYGQIPATINVGLTQAKDGENTLRIWPVSYNGEAAESADTTEYTFTYIDEEGLTQAYVPLFEGFSASTCGPCATANRYFNPVLEELVGDGSLNAVKYQMNFPYQGDPYYTEICSNRDEYYNYEASKGVPTFMYNGEDDLLKWENDNYDQLVQIFKDRVAADHERKAMVELEIPYARVDSTGMLQMELNVKSHIEALTDVQVMVLEKTTYNNKTSNGEKEFHWVTMASPTRNGKGISSYLTPGKDTTYNFTVDMNGTHVEELSDLKVICFVQEKGTWLMFQSAGKDVEAIGIPEAANTAALLSGVKLYPNPARTAFTLSGLDNASVEIFNLAGQRVYNEKNLSGQRQLSTGSMQQGLYMVRISQNGASAVRKLSVVK